MQVCSSCGRHNDDQARFCSNCGSALATGSTSTVEERKVVSVLFVDLVGFTARSDHADPEDVRATLRVYHELLKREIERYGGTVEKFIGDAVMAVFGAPIAHEDDAERAVRAALRILEAIEELNEARPELDLAVRGAVNTGEAVVAIGARPEAGEGFVTGDVVNVASRLQGAAPVGAVVVGELTHRPTRDVIEYEELEPISVKGKDRPIPIWRAVAARSRFGVDVEPGTSTPLIGRSGELSLLQGLFERVLRDQTPHLVTLSGEPGVGKSRLTREFRTFIDDLPDLISWRQGRCLPYGEGITFWALSEIVKSHAGILENDGPDEAAAKLTVAVEIVEDDREREWIRTRLGPLIGIGDETAVAEREESFAAWRGFLEAIAASGPFVLVIEDLHWADPSMLEFVEHLADWASGVPLFILCTARPELYEREPSWGGGKRNHTAVSLPPLSADETAQLIAVLLDQTVLPAETQRALLERAGGNPLYAEEFIRMLVDRGVLIRSGASWELTAGEGDIPVPENVQALIAARLDTLPAGRKALLQDAAVIGKVFWVGALAEMGGLDPEAVRADLHELARKELLRPARRSSIEGEAEYAFSHLLIRDVAYGQIPRAQRAAGHRSAAAWIEAMAGERVADNAEVLAYHYEQAIELARAAGDDTRQLEALAVRFLLMASDRAIRLDVEKAFELNRRALELTQPGEPERLQVLMSSSRAAVSSWVAQDPLATAEQALEEARGQGNRLAEGEVLSTLSQAAWVLGDTARQVELLRSAVEILEEFPPGRELARALSRSVASAGLAGLSARTLELAESALPVIREFGAEHDLAVALQFRGQARTDLGEPIEGIADLNEGLRIALESSPAGFVCAAYVNLADIVWFDEGPSRAEELFAAAIEFGERRGAAGTANWARMETMWTRFDLGRWDEVLQLGDLVLEIERDRGGQAAFLAVIFQSLVRVARGDLDLTSMIEDEIVPRAREIGDGQVVLPALRLAAMNRLLHADAAAGVAFVRELSESMSERPGFHAGLLEDSARVCFAGGAVQLLRELTERAAPHLWRDRNCVLSTRAALAELKGDSATALELHVEAAEQWAAFPHAFEHGHALLGAGRSLLALGRESEARERLLQAREVFASLGAAPAIAETDELLAQATAKSS
ncbi:MAG: adenylate/guanylate cyclase domain-containing protein [Actinomycetota bacterium]